MRSTDVLNYKNVNRFASYFNGNSANIKALEDNYNNGNISAVRSIIAHNSAYNFIGNLMTVYDTLVTELTRCILDSNVTLRDNKKIYGSSIAKPPKRSTVIIYVKYKKGNKTFTRQQKRDFTKRESTFIKNNKHRSNKELVTLYNSYFKNRTESSIITKKYRI